MSARFADAAVRLAGQAGLLLGWRPAEAWAATPEELGATLRAASGSAAARPLDATEMAALLARDEEGSR